MKNNLNAIIFTLSFLFFVQISLAQDSTKTMNKEAVEIEKEAEYPGGAAAWKIFIEKNVQGNIAVKNKAPVGNYPAVVSFTIDTDGSVSNARATTKFDYGMEDEIIRVVEKSGKWQPALKNGKPVKAYRKQPVNFVVESADFTVTTKVPYTLFANMDNEITVAVKKVKAEDLSINIAGGKIIAAKNGRFTVRITKPGRVIMEIINSKKDDEEIGLVSFEVN